MMTDNWGLIKVKTKESEDDWRKRDTRMKNEIVESKEQGTMKMAEEINMMQQQFQR